MKARLRTVNIYLESWDGHLCGRGPQALSTLCKCKCGGRAAGSGPAFHSSIRREYSPADAKLGWKGDACQVIKFKALSGQLGSLPGSAIPKEEGGRSGRELSGLRMKRLGLLPAASFPEPLLSRLNAGSALCRPHRGEESKSGRLGDC